MSELDRALAELGDRIVVALGLDRLVAWLARRLQ